MLKVEFTSLEDIKRLSNEIVAIAHDLTTALHSEDPVPNAFFMDVMANAQVCVLLCRNRNPDYPIFFVNDYFLQSTGYTREQVMGKDPSFLQGPDSSPESIQKISEALHAEQPINITVRNYRQDGTPFWNELFISPVRDHEGVTYAFIGLQRVIADDPTLVSPQHSP